MRCLTKLNLSNSILEPGGFEHIPGLEMLRELNVSYNILNDKDILRIGKIKGLEVLRIYCCNNVLRPKNIGYIKRLERLRELDHLRKNGLFVSKK